MFSVGRVVGTFGGLPQENRRGFIGVLYLTLKLTVDSMVVTRVCFRRACSACFPD